MRFQVPDIKDNQGILLPLIAAVAEFSAVDQGQVRTAADWLITPMHVPLRGDQCRSILNNDGIPLQACLSLSAEKISVRLIGDPCTGVADPVERFRQSVLRMHDIIHRTNSQNLARHSGLMVEQTLPSHPDQQNNLQYGCLWLATGIHQQSKGMALYTTLEWGESNQYTRWQRVREWLQSVLPAGSDTLEQLGAIPDFTWPVSAGLEGSTDTDAVAKIYARLQEPQSRSLRGIGVDGFDTPEFADFSERILCGRTIPETGMVLSLGVALATGQLVSVKLDICGHCVPRPPGEWQDTILQLARNAGTQSIMLEPLLTKQEIEVAFIGLGRSSSGNYRVNVYLKVITAR